LWVYTRSQALAPWEKVLFTGASLRNWARTIAASPNKKLLLDGLFKGLRHSLKAPRSNAQVLQGIYALRDVQEASR
ncbi:hypothetical protein, partial [Chryseobacterium sp. SIMBA_029]